MWANSPIRDYFDEEADDTPCFSGLWTKYSSLFHLVQPPRPQSSMLMWTECFSSNGRNNQTPKVTFANIRIEILRFGGQGSTQRVLQGLNICPSTVVSDIDTYHKSTLVLPSQTNWRFEPSLDNCCRLANAALGTAWSYRNCKVWQYGKSFFWTQLCSLWNRCIHRSYGHTFISASGPTTGEKKKGKEQVRCHRPGILGMARSSWLVAHLQRLKMGIPYIPHS